MSKFAVIGTGKMGQAMAAGLLAKKIFQPGEIIGVDRDESAKFAFVQINARLQWEPDIAKAVEQADVVLIAVKPNHVANALAKLKNHPNPPLYISIAAGLSLERLKSILGENARIIRAMPNTPVLVGEGVIAFAENHSATTDDVQWAQTIFSAVGKVFHVPETALDAVTALSGSGPAYFYLFISELAKAATARGLDSKTALEMAVQTARGAAVMLEQSGGRTPEDLIADVRSKGGTTEAALHSFAETGLPESCKQAVEAAWKRARELMASS